MDFINKLQEKPLNHIKMGTHRLYPFEDLNDYSGDYIAMVRNKMLAEVVDTQDRVILEAVIRAAEEAGFTDLYILDKKFVMDALREKMEREGLA